MYSFELEFSENGYPYNYSQNSTAMEIPLFTIFPGTERVNILFSEEQIRTRILEGSQWKMMKLALLLGNVDYNFHHLFRILFLYLLFSSFKNH